jgi:hypothetical protein
MRFFKRGRNLEARRPLVKFSCARSVRFVADEGEKRVNACKKQLYPYKVSDGFPWIEFCMPDTIVVTSANAPFFPFAQDLVLSLRDKPFRHAFDIGLLDTGLDAAQQTWLATAGVKLANAALPPDLPNVGALEQQNPAFRTLVSQFSIPAIFPGYTTYVWIDADIWVQTAEGVDAAIDAARQAQTMAIAPEFDRCYTPFFDEPGAMWDIYRQWYAGNFDEQTTRQMMFRPMFNVGFWAIPAESPLLGLWFSRYREVLQRTEKATNVTFMAHQLTLNILFALEKQPYVSLPAAYNWLTAYTLPAYDPQTGLYVEPQPPYRPISNLHLTRPVKAQVETLRRCDGGTITTRLMRRARPKAG